MADSYPWGALAPAKRVATIETQIVANDKKRTECIEAHKKRLGEIDEIDRKLKGDLKQAVAIVEKEAREATVAAATKAFEKVMASMVASGVNVNEIVRNGDFEKILGKTISEAGAKPKAAKKSGTASETDPMEPAGDAA